LKKILKILFSSGIILLHCIGLTAQCVVDYGLTDPNTLLITSKSQTSENLFFRDHYEDLFLGNTYIDVSTGLFLHMQNKFNITHMEFLVVVHVNSDQKINHFNATAIYFRFEDKSGFELKTDTIIRSVIYKEYHYCMRAFYLNNIAFSYLMHKPVEMIVVTDDISDKQISLYPAKNELIDQSECISNFVPRETTVEQYSKVLDSLIYQKKYGNH
jgi:hypothetical protein